MREASSGTGTGIHEGATYSQKKVVCSSCQEEANKTKTETSTRAMTQNMEKDPNTEPPNRDATNSTGRSQSRVLVKNNSENEEIAVRNKEKDPIQEEIKKALTRTYIRQGTDTSTEIIQRETGVFYLVPKPREELQTGNHNGALSCSL